MSNGSCLDSTKAYLEDTFCCEDEMVEIETSSQNHDLDFEFSFSGSTIIQESSPFVDELFFKGKIFPTSAKKQWARSLSNNTTVHSKHIEAARNEAGQQKTKTSQVHSSVTLEQFLDGTKKNTFHVKIKKQNINMFTVTNSKPVARYHPTVPSPWPPLRAFLRAVGINLHITTKQTHNNHDTQRSKSFRIPMRSRSMNSDNMYRGGLCPIPIMPRRSTRKWSKQNSTQSKAFRMYSTTDRRNKKG